MAFSVVSLALAGCGSSGSQKAVALSTSGNEEAWSALERVPGSLLFACGPNTVSADVYVKDEGGAVRRLTESPPQLGVTDIGWLGQQIVLVTTRQGTESVEIRDLDTPAASPGQLVADQAGTPAVSAAGEVAFTRATERRGRLVVEVVRTFGGKRRVVSRQPNVWSLWWVAERLHALVESRGRRYAIVDVTHRWSRRRTPLENRVGGTTLSSEGRLAYLRIARRGKRAVVMRLDGTGRSEFPSRWVAIAWSLDERQILVSNPPLIGLMSPSTGKVQRLGSLPCGRVVIAAAWRETTS